VPFLYYVATALFLFADYAFDINLRLAFLDAWPGWRLAWYGLCFGCAALIGWRPGLADLVMTVESLCVLAALIIGMGYRVMTMSVGVLEGTATVVTTTEIVNFGIAGFAAWYGWWRGSIWLGRRLR